MTLMANTFSDLDLARHACREGASVAQRYFRNATAENKAGPGAYDPVTQGDRDAETRVRSILHEHRPDDGIHGEEFGKSVTDNNREWIIDPIDGTRAFVSGVPTWGTLVGLTVSGDHAVGAACQPMTGDFFSGDGQTATLNNAAIKTRGVTKVADLRIATTAMDLLDQTHRAPFEALSKDVSITRFGLDWYAYAILATGGFDVVVECGLQPYDISALIPIIRGAGGVVTDLTGGPNIGPTVLACSNANVHAHMLKHFR